LALAALRPYPKFKGFDTAGNALDGGLLYTYVAGTSTNLATYTTPAASVANANPVVLDANGEADVWFLARDYKLVLKNSAGVTQWTVDNFDGSNLTVTGAINELKSTDIVCAATIDLDAATGNIVHITGSTGPITAFTLASGAERTVVFDSTPTITHNATTLILPGGQNIVAAAGDRMIIRGDGANNVRVIAYIRAGGAVPNQAKGTDIVCAATINLNTATGDFVHVTGSTGPVTAITLASGAERTVVFDSTPTLTHHATTLILPGAANITAAAGDRATFRGDGSGNTRCIHYTRANGAALTPAAQALVYLSAVTASDDATVDMETTFDSTYDVYLITGTNVVLATDGTTFGLNLKITGAYSATSYIGHFTSVVSGTATYLGVANATTSIRLGDDIGNVTNEGINFTAWVFAPSGTTLLNRVHGDATYISSSGLAKGGHFIGANTVAGAVTGVRFLAGSGNITSGTFRLYGIANS
jgi:hypothetical protein